MDSLVKLINKEKKTKIVLVVLDGLGDLPVIEGKTPLELARTPNLDRLVKTSATGLHIPVDYGITPGSGPGHLGIFGYEPLKYEIGRGILEALGLGLDIRENDIAIRGNFATVSYDKELPVVIDRRAGRISTEENHRLIQYLSKEIQEIEGVKVILCSGKEHRFSLILRFQKKLSPLAEKINDTDPQSIGKPPLVPKGQTEEAEEVAKIVEKFINKAANLLKGEKKANYVLLRGFSVKPHLSSFYERFALQSLCIAVYPMYKGLARLVGMDVATFEGETIKDEIETLKKEWESYDFFFVHIKKTDSYGEDGNFEGKIKVIEEFDQFIPEILELNLRL